MKDFPDGPPPEGLADKLTQSRVIHFIGIGGIGMSAIADMLFQNGHKVQGSDLSANANVERLRSQGMKIYEGHDAPQIDGADLIVISTAIKDTNPELKLARERNIEVVTRGEMLAWLTFSKKIIAISGTHGKTTTTALIGTVLETAGLDPTIVNGGIMQSSGSNLKVGTGDWAVTEADESDGSFLRLPSTAAVITNLDPEHIDYWKSEENLFNAYREFIEKLPERGGFCVACADHPNVKEVIKGSSRKVLTYGIENKKVDLQARKIEQRPEGSTFKALMRNIDGKQEEFGQFFIPVMGLHNISNALAAILVASKLGITADKIAEGLKAFKGVQRRFTLVGEYNGARIIDDYAHHPTEIRAVLAAAKQAGAGNIIAVMQPHRYSRLHELFKEFSKCFKDANRVLISDVYPAGEDPIEGADRDNLVEAIKAAKHKHVQGFSNPDDLRKLLKKDLKAGDYVIFLGAGSVSRWAHDFAANIHKNPHEA